MCKCQSGKHADKLAYRSGTRTSRETSIKRFVMANFSRILLQPLLIMLFLVFSSSHAANTKYQNLLLKDLDDYLHCWQNQNYRCMATYVVPEVVKQLGGVEGFINTMESVPAFMESQGMRLDISSMTIGIPSPVAEYKGVLISVVPTRIPLHLHGERAVVNGSIVALSENQGGRWYYVEGTTEGAQFLASTFGNDLFRYINVPRNTMELNGQVFPVD